MADEHTGLGRLIDGDKGRDAIHIAIAPVEATEKLMPGQGINLVEGDNTRVKSARGGTWSGIVDPFLQAPVLRGERFWMWMRPGSITSLRHEWTHPAFGPEVTRTYPASEQWIREWAEGYGVTYADMIEAAKEHLRSGEYFSRGGTFEGENVPDEFWSHFERVTGQVVPSDDRNSFFSCSC